MTASPRLSLPFLSAGQAQKEFFVNESLQVLDTLVGGAVEEAPRNDPPQSPSVGEAYIVGPAPTGAWAGKSQAVAVYTDGGPRFIDPVDGMSLLMKTTDGDLRRGQLGGGRRQSVEPLDRREPGRRSKGGVYCLTGRRRSCRCRGEGHPGPFACGLRSHGLIAA